MGFNTLTIEDAIKIAPAIGATKPLDRVSDSYRFVSSRDILETVQENGWRITNASAQNASPFAQHRVTLIHENYLDADVTKMEGVPRIDMFNSHDRTKRLMFAIGYFRFVCSNGLMIASGPAESIKIKHRFTGDHLKEIMEQVGNISERFPGIMNTIEAFKTRDLSESEQRNFTEYAVRGRFCYRPAIPKRFRDMDVVVDKFLAPRRDEDAGNNVWQVYNRVQENLVKGIEGFNRPIKGYSDNIRVNQLLWKGAEVALVNEGNKFTTALAEILVKDSQKGNPGKN